MRRDYLLRQDWIVNRPRLHDMLRAGLRYPLTCVTAGQGYGKTTAVADFCRHTRHRLIWLNLLPLDNDTRRFWRRFLDGIKHELPELEKKLSESNMGFPETLDLFDSFARIFAADEGYRNNETLLVFDNAENIESGPVQEFIASLCQVEWENLCIILISSTQSTFRKQAATWKHYFIGAEELCFTEGETASLFEHYGRQIDPAKLKRLYDYTGGWPLPLNLIASHPHNDPWNDFEGSSHLQVIAGLFEQHYYANFSEDMRRLLIKISLLPNIGMGLVRALGFSEESDDCAALLDNNFISYNYSHDLLYLQNMYQEFLVRKKETLADAEIVSLYSTAGDWYKRHGYYREALECYWAIRDFDNFLDVIKIPPRRWVSREYTNWILNKLDRFPDDYRIHHEELNFFRALLYVNDAQIEKAKDLLLSSIQSLREQNELSPEGRDLLAAMYAVMVDISVIQNNMDGPDYAQKALELAPNGVRIRSEKMMVAGNKEIFFLPDNRPGSLRQMIDYAAQMKTLTEKLYRRNGQGYFDLFIAEASFLSGDTLQAWEYSARTIHIADYAHQHDIVANALFLQIRIARFLGDVVKAELFLRRLVEYIEKNAPHELVGLKDCASAFFYMQMNDIKKVPFWIAESANLPTNIPLNIGRDRLMCAAYLCLTGKFEKAYAILLELDSLHGENRQWSMHVYALILKAVCMMKMNKKSRAAELLYRAYDMTRQNGITICFVEMGQRMLDLLEVVDSQDDFHFDLSWVETVRAETRDFIKREAIMVKHYKADLQGKRETMTMNAMTPREAEVFSYWAKGLSRDEIANILGISTHGVKKHVMSVYAKLGAVNRLDAIHIATANDLLK